ncbi:MAG: hypothetical protein RBG13Loki_3237 [Promethearchaeota archaeon CR_4]|nr:MAG: hypothetical protein RBG13Loki_3237 [Candidatus Lokiarchaeota archaeon CR_4]
MLKEGSATEAIAFHSIKHHLIPRVTPQQYVIPEAEYYRVVQEIENGGNNILVDTEKEFEAAGVKVQTILVKEQEPEEYAIDAVDKEGVDLVVLGCKGSHSKMRQIFLGTVPSRLLNAARCDVLVVR